MSLPMPAALLILLLAGAVAPAAEHADRVSSDAPDAAPYVPTPHDIVTRMLELGEVGPGDHLIDLGSGDGRIVLTAARERGATGLGVEIRGDLVVRARRAARRQGVANRVRFEQRDLFETDLSDATVVTLYLLPETLERLRPKLLEELDPGTRVISHDYPVEGWDPERFVQLQHADKVAVTGVSRTNLYLYRVPAKVAGRWTASVPPEVSERPLALEFAQGTAAVRGRAHLDDATVQLERVELAGRRLSFILPGRNAHFTGRLENGRLSGFVNVDGARRPWRATRG